MRNVTLALPTALVRDLLPDGLELGPQEMTPRGTHPVVMGFHDMFRLHPSIPSLLPSMTYFEHSVGIPYCFVARGRITPTSPGPYYFMPILYLDSLLPMLGGRFFWGFAKELAAIRVSSDRYSVTRISGEPVLSLSYDGRGEAMPADGYPHFELQRQVTSQPLISMVPFGVGPFFTVAGFPKQWDVAAVRPLATVLDIFTDYVAGLPSGRYPAKGLSKGVDVSVMGAYELRAPFQISSPYPPLPR